MLMLISPAKTLDYDSALPPHLDLHAALPLRQPRFARQGAELVKILRGLRWQQVGELMDLSEALARLNHQRYKAWRLRATPVNSRAAIAAFAGDVYEGLRGTTLGAEDIAWADEHLFMLSGLYGLLAPLDALQPYRLEMGTRLANPAGADLYAWWRETVTAELARLLKPRRGPRHGCLLNLASQEYAKVVDRKRLPVPVVDVAFEDWHGGQWKVISFNAKRARGLLARHVITQRIDDPAALAGFAAEGWAVDEAASADGRWVFRRRLDEGAGAAGPEDGETEVAAAVEVIGVGPG